MSFFVPAHTVHEFKLPKLTYKLVHKISQDIYYKIRNKLQVEKCVRYIS